MIISLDYKNRGTELLKISVPIIVEQIFTTLMGVVNTMMASNVGEHAVSAVGMVDSISNLVIAIFAALTTGTTIVVAQYIGKKDVANASEAISQSIMLSIFLSSILVLLFFVFKDALLNLLYGNADEEVFSAANTYFKIINFSYPIIALTQTLFGVLRGSGNTKAPMKFTLIMNVVNIVLGYILIFGINIKPFGISITTRGFGIAGVAYSLLLARLIGLIMVGYYLLFISNTIKISRKTLTKLNFPMQRIILNLGIPTSIESSLFQVGKLLTQVYIVSMGTAALAANSIAGSVLGFINVPGSAFSVAVMILVGQKLGAGEDDDIQKTVFFSIKFGMMLFTIMSIILFPFIPKIISLYGPGSEATHYTSQILYTALITTPLLWSVSFITPAALRATGDVKYTMLVAIISMWSIRIGTGYILGITFGLKTFGTYLAMFLDWGVRGLFFYLRFKSNKWKNKNLYIK